MKRLGPTVDTRGVGGYVLLPPSIFYDEKTGKTGRYKVLKQIDVAELPSWISVALAKTAEPAKAPTGIVLDDPGNTMRAVRHLKGLAPVVEGQGSDDAAFKAAAVLRDPGISEGKAAELMMEHFKCTPKTLDWIELKVRNAFKHAENEPGAYARPPMAERLSHYVAKLGEPEKALAADKAPERSRFYPVSGDEMDAVTSRPLSWLIYELILEKTTTIWVGELPGSRYLSGDCHRKRDLRHEAGGERPRVLCRP